MSMVSYYAYNADGEIVAVGICDESAIEGDHVPTGATVALGSADPAVHFVADGQLRAYTPGQQASKANRPSRWMRWSNGTMSWVDLRSLADIQAKKRAWVDEERERRGHLAIEFQGHTFQADERSQRNVSAWRSELAAGGALPPGFVWRDANDVNHPADAAFVNGLGSAITQRGTALYVQSWALKAQIDAATTISEVEAITWPD